MKNTRVKNKEKLVSDKKIYFLLFAVLLIGIFIGSMYVNNLPEEQKGLLLSDINTFLTLNMQNKIQSNLNFFTNILFSNLKYLLVVVILAMSYKCIPIILFVVFFRGFSYGFTSLFLISSYGNYGVKLMFTSYFLSTILQTLLLFLTACLTIKYTISKKELFSKKPKGETFKLTAEFIIMMIGAILLCVLFSAAESFVTPLLLGLMKIK